MKIIALETLRPRVQPNLLFLLLRTDSGLTGLGEAFFSSSAVESYLHENVAELLLGHADPAPERISALLTSYLGYQGAGVETRAGGAVDMAVWDLFGQETGQPLVNLLGGGVRDQVEVYNTCAGAGYVRASSRQESGNWGLPDAGRHDRRHGDRYEDLRAFLTQPGRLARELWDEGLRGMKIWPFDQAAERTRGTDISPAELARGVDVIADIRSEVGIEMKIMIELHGLWNRPAAEKIVAAVAPYRPYWIEDPLRADAAAALGRLERPAAVPIAAGETCVGRRGFLPLLQAGAVDVVTMDIQWTGGITEARKVASLADAFGVPVAPHDCTGPATLATCVHFVCGQPNGLIQETVRAFLRTWYDELVTGLPTIENGMVRPSPQPGHGVRLRPDIDAVRRISRLDGRG